MFFMVDGAVIIYQIAAIFMVYLHIYDSILDLMCNI